MKKNIRSATARLEFIREKVSKQQEVSIPRLAEILGVSEMTIRRDLARLEEMGLLQRTHGGAVSSERSRFEFDHSRRRAERRREKQAIAAEALKLISPGDRIILDNGTTTLELALLLGEDLDLTVVTPSLAVAAALQFRPNIETILLGGVLRQGRAELTGIVTERILEMFAVDIAFQGADGIGLDGRVYVGDPRVAEVDRKIHMRSAKTYLLADHSKIGQTALIQFTTLRDITGLITDSGLSDAHRRSLNKCGGRLIVAGT